MLRLDECTNVCHKKVQNHKDNKYQNKRLRADEKQKQTSIKGHSTKIKKQKNKKASIYINICL